MSLMGREIGVKLCHWAIRKNGLGMKAAKDGNPGKDPTQAATQIAEPRVTTTLGHGTTP